MVEFDYEKEFDKLQRNGMFNPDNVYDKETFLAELRKHDTLGKIHYSFVDSLMNTKHFDRLITANINSLRVTQQKKKDMVTDGEQFVISKNRQVSYYRNGRKITYYRTPKRQWTQKETEWVRENRTLPTKLYLYKFYQNFGQHRTIQSLTTKRYTLGKTIGGTKTAKKTSYGAMKTKPKRRILTKTGEEIDEDQTK